MLTSTRLRCDQAHRRVQFAKSSIGEAMARFMGPHMFVIRTVVRCCLARAESRAWCVYTISRLGQLHIVCCPISMASPSACSGSHASDWSCVNNISHLVSRPLLWLVFATSPHSHASWLPSGCFFAIPHFDLKNAGILCGYQLVLI